MKTAAYSLPSGAPVRKFAWSARKTSRPLKWHHPRQLLLWRLFGLLPFSWNIRRHEYTKRIIPFIWIVIFLCLEPFVMFSPFVCYSTASPLNEIVTYLYVYSVRLTSVTQLSKIFWSGYKTLVETCCILVSVETPKSSSRIFCAKHSFMCLVLVILLMIALSINLHVAWGSQHFACVAIINSLDAFFTITTVIWLDQFVSLLSDTEYSFRKLRQRLPTGLHLEPLTTALTFQQDFAVISKSRVQMVDVQKARSQYMEIMQAAQLLQKNFGLTIAFDVGADILILLHGMDVVLYVASGKFVMSEVGLWGPVLAVCAILLAYSLLRLALLVESCTAVASSAEEIRWRLVEWSQEVPPLHFTAAGLFSINRSLLVSIISITTTYTILLYQFRSM